jgi:hypothetical protein
MCSSHSWGSGSCPFDPELERARPPGGGRRAPRPWSLGALRAELRLGPTRLPAAGTSQRQPFARRRHRLTALAVVVLSASMLIGFAV